MISANPRAPDYKAKLFTYSGKKDFDDSHGEINVWVQDDGTLKGNIQLAKEKFFFKLEATSTKPKEAS